MVQRNNQDWLDELRGYQGREQQYLAHQELARYLHKVVFNYLWEQQANVTTLAHCSSTDLAELAHDFVQETLEKLAGHNFALLNQFKGQGHFTAWAAQIVRRQAGQELRRVYWQRSLPLPEEEVDPNTDGWSPSFKFNLPLTDETKPENAVLRHQVAQSLQTCLQKLPERWRLAFWGCLSEERSTEFVASALNTTPTAVYQLIHRAKRQLKKCLQAAGLDETILEIFE